MRSEAEQISGLRQVQRALWALAQANYPIVLGLGDVPALLGPTEGRQIVFASGGFDGWENGGLTQPDLTTGQAVAFLLANGVAT